jgi:hypothetical protein
LIIASGSSGLDGRRSDPVANDAEEGRTARHEEAQWQKRNGETLTEARQAEPGPSVLVLLVIGTGLAIVVLGIG